MHSHASIKNLLISRETNEEISFERMPLAIERMTTVCKEHVAFYCKNLHKVRLGNKTHQECFIRTKLKFLQI